MEYKDYYKILGVERNASQDEIKRAYRKLTRKYHPDVSKEIDAEEKFKELGEAYEVLKDPQKRSAYNHLGNQWQEGQEFRPPPQWDREFEFSGGGFTGLDSGGFSDFFESLFGGNRWRNADFRTQNVRGMDINASLRVSLEDAYQGANRSINLQIPERDQQGNVRMGKRHLNVKIPKGVVPGQRIRLAGIGYSGSANGEPGDLFFSIEFEPHQLYRVDGRDIYLDLPITPWEAALGTRIAVPTLGGKVDLNIPSGSQSGRKLRLQKRGLPGNPPGDQYVVLTIVTPPADSDQAQKIYQEMGEKLKFNPRQLAGIEQ